MTVRATALLRSRMRVIMSMNASLAQALRLFVLGRGCCSLPSRSRLPASQHLTRLPRTSRLLYHAAFVLLAYCSPRFWFAPEMDVLWSAENGSAA